MKKFFVLFQFPTSGKGHSDVYRNNKINPKFFVSIPYEREGAFRHLVIGVVFKPRFGSFNSLRAGRGIQTSRSVSVCKMFKKMSFNSLRAGRGIQT